MSCRMRFATLGLMAMLTTVAVALAVVQDDAQQTAPVSSPWLLRVTTPVAAVVFDPADETLLRLPDHFHKGVVSPDGARRAYAKKNPTKRRGADLYISGLRMRLTRRVTNDGIKVREIHWSHDGLQIVYVSGIGDATQVYRADLNTNTISRLSDGAAQSWNPRLTADGRVAYTKLRERVGKMQLVDLIVTDGESSTTIIANEPVLDHAWSPDGELIVYDTPSALTIIDVASGETRRTIEHLAIDDRLYAHGARHLTWRPDGKALACTLTFLGGRMVGTEIFGDHELFIIPLDPGDKPLWRELPLQVRRLTWMSIDGAREIGEPVKLEDVPRTAPRTQPPVPRGPLPKQPLRKPTAENPGG